MSRSLWKVTVYKPITDTTINEKITRNSNTLFFTNRASFISETRINHRLFVYNGLRWYDFRVTPERVGHRVGEFAPTRKRPMPKKKKQIKKK